MRDAKKAKEALKDMADAARDESAAEKTGAEQAAQARRQDISVIRDQGHALDQLAASAKQSNVQALYGGRSDMQQHLADLAKEEQLQTLLNRARNMGFTTPQQYQAYRQQLLALALNENKARFGGYLTPDQWLTYLQKEITATNLETAAMKSRAAAIRDETSAMLEYDNAVQGTHQSIGQLGEGLSAANAYAAALTGLPDVVVTQADFDASRAMTQLAMYRAALMALPSVTRLAIMPGQPPEPGPPIPIGPPEPGALPPPDRRALPPGTMGEGPGSGWRTVGGIEAFIASVLRAVQAADRYQDAEAGLAFTVRGLDGDQRSAAASAYLISLAQRVLADDTGKATASIEELRAAWAKLTDEERIARAGGAFGAPPLPPRGPPGPPGLPPGPPEPPALPPGGGPGPDDARAAEALAEAMDRLRGAQDAEAQSSDRTAQEWLRMAESADTATRAAAYVRAAAIAERLAQQQAGDAAEKAGRQVEATVPGLIKATGGWFGLAGTLTVFGGFMGTVAVWHVVLDALIEAVAILIPAIVTLIAGLAAFGLAGLDAGKAVYNRLVDVYNVSDAWGASLPPLTGKLEKLHEQVRPMVWQLYGDAIDIVTSKNGIFNRLAVETGREVDRLAGKLTVFVDQASKGLDKFFAVGGQNLAQLGRILASLGNAFMNLIRVTQQTHIDQIFLQILVAASKLLDMLTRLPTPILALIVGIHGLWLWGGLLATILLSLLNPIKSVALALGGLAATQVAENASSWTRLTTVLGDIVAGFAAIPGRITGLLVSLGVLTGATDAAAASEDGLAASAGAAAIAEEAEMMATGELAAAEVVATGMTFSLAGAMGVLLAALPYAAIIAVVAAIGFFIYKVATAKDTTQQWIDSLNAGLGKSGLGNVIANTIQNLAAVTQQLAAVQHGATGNASELSAAQADLSGKLQTELGHVGQVSKAYGTDLAGALALLNTAGVKTSDLFTNQANVWAADLQQVKGLVDGYRNMGQGLTQLQGDVSVQIILQSDALTAMNKLNQAWDQWFTIVTGGQTDLVKFLQTYQSLTQQQQVAGASTSGLNSQSLALRSTYNQLLPQAESYVDWVRTQAAVTQSGESGQKQLTRAVRDYADILGPAAGGNKALQDSVIALINEVDPSITTWQQATKWMGKQGAAQAAADLNTQATQLEKPLSDLQQDAQKLGASLQNDLVPAMTNATKGALGAQSKFNTFSDDLFKFGPNSQKTIDAAAQVASVLIAIDGNSKKAHDQFVAWAGTMGVTRDQAEQLWKSATKIGSAKYQLQVEDNIKHVQSRLDVLQAELGKTTDPKKRKLIELEIKYEKDKLDQLNGQLITAAGNAGKIDKNIAGAGNTAGKLAQSSVWAQIRDKISWALSQPTGISEIEKFFTKTLPNSSAVGSKSAAQHWADNFNRTVGRVFTSDIPHWATTAAGAVSGSWITGWHGFYNNVQTPVHNFFNTQIPSWAASAGGFLGRDFSSWYNSFHGNFIVFVGRAFMNLIPGWMGGATAAWGKSTSGMAQGWANNVNRTVGHFFTSDVPNWATSFGSTMWSTGVGIWHGFYNNVQTPMHTFFNTTIPNWLGGFVSGSDSSAVSIWHGFYNNVQVPLHTFFNKTIPGWLSGMVGFFAGSWIMTWHDFYSSVWTPFHDWITKTLPNWLSSDLVPGFKLAWDNVWGGFKNAGRDAINWVIDHVINHGIFALINDVTGVFGVHIHDIGLVKASGGDVPFARMASGSVAGPSAVDGTPILAMGGEYVLRQSARMALQSAYGPGFLPMLNQADSWLGSGSRGIAASQRYALGGQVNPVGPGLTPERVDMGVDYGGSGPLYAIGSGTIRNLYNSGWPGGTFIDLQLNPFFGTGYWYYAEDITPAVSINQGVSAGQRIGTAWGGPSGIEIGWASGVGGQTAAARDGQENKHGDPGAFPTAWGVAASNLIKSLGGPPGIISGPVHGGTPGFGGFVGAIEGFLDGAGSALTGAGRALAGLIGGSASSILALARKGARALFDAAWGHTVTPMLGHLGDDVPGTLAQLAGHEIKAGVDSWLGRKDSAAQAQSAASGLPGAPPAVGPIQQYAKKLLAQYGWSGQWSSFDALEMHEAGWNPTAQNPASTAYGIGQFLDSTWATVGGHKTSDPYLQLQYMMAYIKQRYGSPNAAWAQYFNHPGGQGSYAGGGPVRSAGPAFPGGLDAEDTWLQYSTTVLPSAVRSEMDAFWGLFGTKLPKKTSAKDWAQWYAEELILAAQQRKTIGMGTAPAGAYMALSEDFVRPEVITPGMWSTFASRLNTLTAWQGGPGEPGGSDPPRSAWHYETQGKWPKGQRPAPGRIQPSGYPGWKHLHPQWIRLRNRLLDLKAKAKVASQAWNALYAGAGLAGGVPGPGAAPPPAPPPFPGLEAVVTIGGPPEPVIGSPPDSGYGFAAGGIADVAALFALGGPVPGIMPPSPARMFSGSPSGSEFPRSLSDAGASGRGIGFNVESMTINNPVAEAPSESITRASNRLAFLAGRGMALCPRSRRRSPPTARPSCGTGTGLRSTSSGSTSPPWAGPGSGCRCSAARTTRCRTGPGRRGGPSSRTSAR